MSTDALSFGAWESDSPWRRLYWTLPTALTIWVTAVVAFTFFVRGPSERLPEPPPIDAQVIEISPPKANPAPREKRPPPPIKPVTPFKPPAPALAPAPQPTIDRNAPQVQEQRPVMQAKTPVMPETPVPPPVPEKPITTGPNLTATSAAQAIVRPMPQIPDELRQDALSASATARFRVAADGTATAELVKPTPNPRLNRLLLNSLRNWRFFPAMKDGQPVASTEEIVITVEVK